MIPPSNLLCHTCWSNPLTVLRCCCFTHRLPSLPPSTTPPLDALLRRYSGPDQGSHQNWFRQVGGALRHPGVLKMKNVNFSRGDSVGPPRSQNWAPSSPRTQPTQSESPPYKPSSGPSITLRFFILSTFVLPVPFLYSLRV